MSDLAAKGGCDILVIEDSPADFRRIVRQIRRGGLQARCVRAGTMAEIDAASGAGGLDAVLTEYGIPGLDFESGLALLRARLPDAPVILVSGRVGEEKAVELLKLGVRDYVLKDRLLRLAPAIRQSLREAGERHARRAAEQALGASECRFRALLDSVNDAIFIQDAETGCILDVNRRLCEMFGCTREEALACSLDGLGTGWPPHSSAEAMEKIRQAFAEGPQTFEWMARLRDGRRLWVEANLRGAEIDGRRRIVAVWRDITQRKLAEARIAASESRLRAIIETEPECIKVVDPSGCLLQMNPAGLSMIEADSLEQVAGQSVFDLIGPVHRQAYVRMHERVVAGEPQKLEYEMIGLKGRRLWLETNAVPMPDGSAILHLAITRDITQRKQAEDRLRLAASVFANSYEGIIVTDAANVIADVNPAFTRITGYEKEDVIGKTPKIFASGRQGAAFYAEMWKSLQERDVWRGEIWNRRKNGEIYAEMLSISIVRDAEGRLLHHIGVFSDITLLKKHEAELDRIAHYDTLTGVPNRRLLADRLAQAIARARRSGKPLAVCYLDLDGFKPINDRFGHAAGDRLLIEVTRRLLGVLRAEDTLARLGGDEFALLFTELRCPEESHAVLERILEAIRVPVSIGDFEVGVSASIGITLYPPDKPDADILLRHADQAMYYAKEIGKNRYHLFDPEQDRQTQSRRHHLQRLGEALQNGEFVLHYQPKADLVNGEIVGAEALIRWQHPEEGLLPPAAFLHHLEGSDLEIAVGDWVIESVLRQMEAWQAAGLRLVVSANVSANHLLQAGFCERLRLALERHPDVPPANLELEILETAALGDMVRAVDTLAECRKLGVRFALDDFGTGYSSLAYFRNLPVDILKIDQSFVHDMLEDPNDLGIVEGVVHLAQAFNRPMIAEGVETLEHGALLVYIGCRLCQGYGIARAMPAEQMPAWIEQWHGQAAWTALAQEASASVDLQLRVAARSHVRWVELLVECLGDGQVGKLAELDSRQCRFGHWTRPAARYATAPCPASRR
jgi:diguanylate cyclase (GGDEF)-like protein/PAS domain S-box-containing protein